MRPPSATWSTPGGAPWNRARRSRAKEFSPRHPLFGLGPSAAEREVRLELTGTEADRLHLVTALQDGAAIPQGAEVAVVTLEAMAPAPPLRFVLRAGHETAERLHDERTAHTLAAPNQTAWSLIDRRSEGAFYLARFAWPETRPLRALSIEYTAAEGRLLVFGGSLRAGDTSVALSPFMGAGFRRLRDQEGAVLYENVGARPRAYAVHRIVRVETLRGGRSADRKRRGSARPGGGRRGSGRTHTDRHRTLDREDPDRRAHTRGARRRDDGRRLRGPRRHELPRLAGHRGRDARPRSTPRTACSGRCSFRTARTA